MSSTSTGMEERWPWLGTPRGGLGTVWGCDCRGFGAQVNPGKCAEVSRGGWHSIVPPWHGGDTPPFHTTGLALFGTSPTTEPPGTGAAVRATSAWGHRIIAHMERAGSFPDQTGPFSPAGRQ